MLTLFFAFVTVFLIIKLNELLGSRIGFMQENDGDAQNNSSDFISPRESCLCSEFAAKVMKCYPAFNEDKFLATVEVVFKNVFTAYAACDKDTLKMLLSPKLYTAFAMAIDDRQSKGEVLSGSIERIASKQIIAVDIADSKISVDVKFSTEQITILKNANGTILEGSEDYINNVIEIWTFTRSIDSTSNQWFLSKIKYESEV